MVVCVGCCVVVNGIVVGCVVGGCVLFVTGGGDGVLLFVNIYMFYI